MPLNTRQLEIIRTVMRSGSVTDAASHLGISQPAVSMAIKACEKAVGFSLFVRKQGRLQATPEAKALYPELEHIFDGIERVRRLAEDLRDVRIGLIRIAATPILADSLLALAVHDFLLRHPKIQISIQAMPNYEVAENVVTERVDLGLVLSPEKYLDTRVTDLYTSSLVCVTPANHPLARHEKVSGKDLVNFPHIAHSRSLPLGSLVDDYFRNQGLKRLIAAEITQSSTACALVRAGVGIAILDPFTILSANSHGLAKIKLTPSTSVSAQLLFPAHGRISRPARALVQILRETVRGVVNKRAV